MLTGAWTNSFGTVWTVKADGSFDVDLDRDGKRDAWGTYTVAGDVVTITGLGETVKGTERLRQHSGDLSLHSHRGRIAFQAH